MTNPTLWNQLLIWPIANVLIGFYRLFEVLHIPGPLGWAVILMTITARLLLYPLMNSQMKSAKKMADLKPHLDALTEKHKNDKAALQQAQLALYKERGVNPAAGCLPLLVQMPILIALYNVFYQVLNAKDIAQVVADMNHIVYMPWLKLTGLDLTFLGTNLGYKPSQWQMYGWWMLAVPVVTGLLQWYQQKLVMPKPQAATPGEKQANGTTALSVKKEEQSQADQAAEMQKQMAIISPLMFGFFALQFPLGLALYWNVFGLFGIIQQLSINKHS